MQSGSVVVRKTRQRDAPVLDINVLEPVGLVLVAAVQRHGHARVDEPRRDRVDPDAVDAELAGQAPGEVDDPALGGRVGQRIAAAAQTIN